MERVLGCVQLGSRDRSARALGCDYPSVLARPWKNVHLVQGFNMKQLGQHPGPADCERLLHLLR
jgi:hypothetical protein